MQIWRLQDLGLRPPAWRQQRVILYTVIQSSRLPMDHVSGLANSLAYVYVDPPNSNIRCCISQ